MLFVWVEGCCQPLFSRFPSSAETSNWRIFKRKSNIVGFGGQNSPLLKKGQVHFGRQMVKLEDKIPNGGHL